MKLTLALLLTAATAQAISIDTRLTDNDTLVLDIDWPGQASHYLRYESADIDYLPLAMIVGHWREGLSLDIYPGLDATFGRGHFWLQFTGPQTVYIGGDSYDFDDRTLANSIVTFDGSLLIPTGDYSVRAIWGVIPDLYRTPVPDGGATWILLAVGLAAIVGVKPLLFWRNLSAS